MKKIKYKDKGKEQSIKIHADDDYSIDSSLTKRCASYITDEPYTLEWLESFTDNSVFYDIGSNIGGFSFIASVKNPTLKVFSFEPNFMNFYCQLKTCIENKLENIFPMNLAINDNNEYNLFKYDWLRNGAKGTFGDKLSTQMKNSDYSNPFKRGIASNVGILGVSLDSLVYEFGLDIPNYLKIDVDGNDLLVLEGAKKLLHEDSVKEIFVEIDDKIYINNEIENFMKKYPYKIKNDIDVGTIHKPMRMVLYVRD
tara:strand:+ start:165 stop:926 length:762 start_codon:yes stop_codon:yes gene_type:complete